MRCRLQHRSPRQRKIFSLSSSSPLLLFSFSFSSSFSPLLFSSSPLLFSSPCTPLSPGVGAARGARAREGDPRQGRGARRGGGGGRGGVRHLTRTRAPCFTKRVPLTQAPSGCQTPDRMAGSARASCRLLVASGSRIAAPSSTWRRVQPTSTSRASGPSTRSFPASPPRWTRRHSVA